MISVIAAIFLVSVICAIVGFLSLGQQGLVEIAERSCAVQALMAAPLKISFRSRV
jgi:hypothetical protein